QPPPASSPAHRPGQAVRRGDPRVFQILRSNGWALPGRQAPSGAGRLDRIGAVLYCKERCHKEVGAPAQQDCGSSVYGNMSGRPVTETSTPVLGPVVTA